MDNVTDITSKKKTIEIVRAYCDDCSRPLQYWLGPDNNAYGICPCNNAESPETLTISMEDWEQ